MKQLPLEHTVPPVTWAFQTTCGVLSTYWGSETNPDRNSDFRKPEIRIGDRGSSGIDAEVDGGGSEGYRDWYRDGANMMDSGSTYVLPHAMIRVHICRVSIPKSGSDRDWVGTRSEASRKTKYGGVTGGG